MENKKRDIGYFSQKHADYIRTLPNKHRYSTYWFDKNGNEVQCTNVIEDIDSSKEYILDYESQWGDVICLGELDRFSCTKN